MLPFMMAFQAKKNQDGSSQRKSFIPAPKIYSKRVSITTPEETVKIKKEIIPGDRVCISGIKKGTVRYFGKLHVSDGFWCGIELDEPEGLNEGKIEDVRYFSCKPAHGIFAPIEKVELIHTGEKTYTTWAKVSNFPEKRVEHDGRGDKEPHKLPLPLTYETLKDGILGEQPPGDVLDIGWKSALSQNSLKPHFEHSKLQQGYQQQPQQQPQQHQQPQQQQPYPQYQQQYFQYSQSQIYSQQQYSQQYRPQQYAQQQIPAPPYLPQQQQQSPQPYLPQQQQQSPQPYLPQQQQQSAQPYLSQPQQSPQPLLPQYPLQQIPPYPQQYPCQQLQPAYPNQQILTGQQPYQQPPIPLQHQPPQVVPALQQQTSQQLIQPLSYHQQVGPTIPQPYQPYPQQSASVIPDQQQQPPPPPPCQPTSPKHSSVYTTHDKPLDGFNSEGGGSDGSSNGSTHNSSQNPSGDIEFSASVKEYLESDRRTYFNFTFDGDSGSSRSASTIPDSLTSSANQVEQELDPAGAIWELENTDDEVSFRLEETLSESSSLTASTEEKPLLLKLQHDVNTSNSNSPTPPTVAEEAPGVKIFIQKLEKELQDNIAKKENYYKSLAQQSSRERDGKDIADGQRKEVKLVNLEDRTNQEVFSNIQDSGYQPDTLKQPYQTHGLTESFEDEIISKKIPPSMTDSGIIVKEEPESGDNLTDTEKMSSHECHPPHDQLATDLRNGHKDKERPISLISTTSVDTGYVPDTDSEVGTVMNSPEDKLNRTYTICRSDLEEGEAASFVPQVESELESEADPAYPEEVSNFNESEISKDDDKIKPDNKYLEQQETQENQDASKQERNSSSPEKDTDLNKQAEVSKDAPATKSKKNATNKEKAGFSANEILGARSKTDQEKTKNFLSETKSKQEKVVAKVVKRDSPKSKWGTIMSKIETNKENVKLKPKIAVKSKLETYLSQKPTVLAKDLKKPVKETVPKKVTHIPHPDYSKVKSKLFSATASSSTKQRPVTNKRSNVENVFQEMPEGIGSSTVSINSVVSSKSNQSIMGTSTNNTAGKTNQLHRQNTIKSDKGKLHTKIDLIKTERPESASSSRTDATQNSVKSMNVEKLQADKNVKSPSTIYQNKVNNTKSPKSKVSTLRSSPSTTDKTNASKEINRLEALCEVRTKDLNYTKLQLKSSLSAFDAMAVLVNYMANDIDAFACPTLTVQLTDVRKELNQAEDQIEMLKNQQLKLEQNLSDCNKQHEKALTDLVNAQSTNLLSQKELLTQQNTENIRKVKEDHGKEIERIKMLQTEKKSDLTLEHKNNVDNLRLTHLEEIRTLQRKHENQMEDLHRQHRDKLEAITHTFESIKMTLSEKVESLRCESKELRNRNRTCEEALEQETNVRVQTALSPYRDLPREIESLKTVLEMRNQEIHDLRNQKIDLEKQLEDLPPALEKITLLQQKIENLEAILQIKSDHEKQLNEKCHGLMRKFNKETRANKRLSMEFDELKWRMSQSELSSSQENILKMCGCSTSGSESGSPDPTRRFTKSPNHWDHKDGGGDQLSSSVTGDGSMESKVKRRSGTFIVHDRPSPMSSPKNRSGPGMPAIQMSQSWAGTGESTTIPSPEESKPLTLSPPSQSLGLPVQPLTFLEIPTSSVAEQTLSTESVSPQKNVDENK